MLCTTPVMQLRARAQQFTSGCAFDIFQTSRSELYQILFLPSQTISFFLDLYLLAFVLTSSFPHLYFIFSRVFFSTFSPNLFCPSIFIPNNLHSTIFIQTCPMQYFLEYVCICTKLFSDFSPKLVSLTSFPDFCLFPGFFFTVET